MVSHFNPRSPHGERRSTPHSTTPGQSDFNPRSPHGERLHLPLLASPAWNISIHAPRTGSDSCPFRACARLDLFQSTLPARGATGNRRAWAALDLDFNPRSPHGERRSFPTPGLSDVAFQSTLPARGATARSGMYQTPAWHFNPRSPHGERHDQHEILHRLRLISIHAPRTGSDAECPEDFAALPISIHAPRTGSDATVDDRHEVPAISIHAPRTGSDAFVPHIFSRGINFNPRSPHGERPE